VSDAVVQQLDLVTAAQQEATTWRNLIPPEPWLPAVGAQSREFAEWVEVRLRTGARNAPATVVNTRKAGQGVRPVPVVGIGERIAYRALTNFILKEITPPARSAQDYRDFVTGPIAYAYQGVGPTHRLGDARLKYVAETDVAAFYQYIDHDTLQQELELQTAHVREAELLSSILGEIQGATFGLPQLLDPSDALSEVYVKLLERDVIRQGILAWRYNDDFRVGATRYEEAQNAIERMSDSARRLGLVLNERKTYISKFTTYLFRHMTDAVDDDDAQIDPSKADTWITDYPDLDDQAAIESAHSTLRRIELPPSQAGRIDLKNLSTEDLRALRQAINILANREDATALPYVTRLFLFAAPLTPRLGDYVVKLARAQRADIGTTWDDLAERHDHSLSDWQRIWLAYIARQAGLLTGSQTRRIDWHRIQLGRGTGLLHAEAALSLAEVGAIEFDELDVSLRMQPEPLAPWYSLAIKALGGAANANRVKAVKDTSAVYRLLIES
jgi:hypothetical protein